MRLLIDTHALIWWLTDPSRLSSLGLDILDDADTEVLVSAVSAYEIEFKRPVDPLLQRLPADLVGAVVDEGLNWLTITPEDAIVAGSLPRHHRDPWDRLLVAQAARNQIPILTRDEAFTAYAVPILW